ncbi:profilin-4-like isoform X2 [Lineus longissimus]|uniref:profilin-4-like isoform X2 n=1 Tax=Lineus longissimus TaxID=88925 RepID=UPI002B4EB3FA
MADLMFEKNPYFKVHGVPDSVKMNQLQNLIHDTLISTDHVQSCAIVNRADASVKASSVGFSLFSDQVIALIEAFKSPSQTREEGIYFNDKQYKCVRADKFSIYAKDGNKGLVVIKTATLLLVATYSEVMKPSICVEAVEKLAEYFREKGK